MMAMTGSFIKPRRHAPMCYARDVDKVQARVEPPTYEAERLIAFDAVHEHGELDSLLNGGGDVLIEFRFEPGAVKGVQSRLFESEFPGLLDNVSQAVLQALPVLAPKTPQFPPIRVSAGANVVEHSITPQRRGD